VGEDLKLRVWFPDSESGELLGRHELRLVVVASGAAFSSASDNSGQEKIRANLSRIPEQYLRRILAQ